MCYEFGYLSDTSLSEALRYLTAPLLNRWYCFVALDSARGADLDAAVVFLGPTFLELSVSYERGPGELWLEHLELQKVLQAGRVIVPFSAVYVGLASPRSLREWYAGTSESERFDQGVPPGLHQAMQESGSLLFMADGDGLNFCSRAPGLASILRATRLYRVQ